MKRTWTLSKDLADPERRPSLAPFAGQTYHDLKRGDRRQNWELDAWRTATGRQEPSPRISEPFLSSGDTGRVLMALGRRKLEVRV